MSFHKLDPKGSPILGRSSRQPDVRHVYDERQYHYEIRYDLPAVSDTRRQRRKRAWLPNDDPARRLEAELSNVAPSDAMTWNRAWERFREAHESKRSQGHLENMERDVRYLTTVLGDKPLAQTTLAEYTGWLDLRERESGGRQAQLARAHTLTIAKWARARGLVGTLPFVNAPRPEYRPKGRRAATVEEFAAYAELLPPYMAPLWRALGYTGARFTGMANLREEEIEGEYIRVTTKRGKRVHYRLLPALQQAIEDAKAYKQSTGLRSPYVFVNTRGNRWTHHSFHNALRRVWREHPQAPRITPHQLRHMWGTIAAARNFGPDLIRAGMGYDDRRSSESYIDPTQEMADRVATDVATFLTHFDTETVSGLPGVSDGCQHMGAVAKCPACGHKFNLYNE